MNLSHATLLIRIPRIGPEMQVGRNCSSLELRPDGLLISSPCTDAGDPCAFDVLVAPWGYSKIQHEEEQQEPAPVFVQPTSPPPNYICPSCSAVFRNSQGLGGHMRAKHP
jgi:hypothetical protein